MGNGNVRKATMEGDNAEQEQHPSTTKTTSSVEQSAAAGHQLVALDNSENSKPVIDLETTPSLLLSNDSSENLPPFNAAANAMETHGIPASAEGSSMAPSAPPPEVLCPPQPLMGQSYQSQPSYPAQPFPEQSQQLPGQLQSSYTAPLPGQPSYIAPLPGQPQPSYAAPLPGQPQPNYTVPLPGQPQPNYTVPLPGQPLLPGAIGQQPWPPVVQSAQPLHGPQPPIGYSIQDALQENNIIQLICKATNKPLTCIKGGTNANGIFGKNNSTFTVVVPKGAADGVIMLHNTVSTGLYLSVNKGGFFNVGKGRKWSHLKPIVQPDNSVSFKSVEWGGLLCFNHKGFPAIASSQQDAGSQFHIRIEKQMNNNTQTITTPFGRPSVANQLRPDCLVQLFLQNFNQYNQYLSVDRTGAVIYIADGNDTETCFKLIDRGMGRFSFQSHKHKTLQLSMVNNTLSAKSGVSDRSVDFQLKENADGRSGVCFESINCPGDFYPYWDRDKTQYGSCDDYRNW